MCCNENFIFKKSWSTSKNIKKIHTHKYYAREVLTKTKHPRNFYTSTAVEKMLRLYIFLISYVYVI